MIYANFAFRYLASLLVDLVGLLVVALAVAWAYRDERLPWWAWPWDNGREPWGDEARKAEMDAATGLKYKWLRWHWFAWRNPGNNFAYAIAIGFKQTSDVVYTHKGDSKTSDQGHPGTLMVKAWRDGEMVAFCYYSISEPWQFFGTRCRRQFWGWKIHDNIDPAQREKNLGTNAQIVGVPNPVMTFKARAA